MTTQEAEELVFKYVDLLNPAQGEQPFARDASQLPAPLAVIRLAMLVYLESICRKPKVDIDHLKSFCAAYSTLPTWVSPSTAQLLNEAYQAKPGTAHQQKLVKDYCKRLAASDHADEELECFIQHIRGRKCFDEFTLSARPPHASSIQTYDVHLDSDGYTWTKFNHKGLPLSQSSSSFTSFEQCFDSIRLDNFYPYFEVRNT